MYPRRSEICLERSGGTPLYFLVLENCASTCYIACLKRSTGGCDIFANNSMTVRYWRRIFTNRCGVSTSAKVTCGRIWCKVKETAWTNNMRSLGVVEKKQRSLTRCKIEELPGGTWHKRTESRRVVRENTEESDAKSESHWIEKIFFGSRRANEPDVKAGKATKNTENVSRGPVT